MQIDLFSTPSYTEEIAEADLLSNHRIDVDLVAKHRGKVQILKHNLASIELLRQLQEDKQHPTYKEAQLLSKYLGWGSIAEVFTDPPPSPTWAKAHSDLKAMLSPDEYTLARGSILTAYYTSPQIIQWMYRVVERLGFQGRSDQSILEGSCGNGLFIGMAPKHWRSDWIGVEIDPISAGIAQKLYPLAKIYPLALERTRLPKNGFSLAISNVPFSQIAPYDAQYSSWHFGGLHDYCLAKAVDCVHPGGLVAILTSVGTLQSSRSEIFREKLSQLARLIGAVKLPMKVFDSFSKTQISCDFLVFQKLKSGEEGNGDLWVETVDSPIIHAETGNPLQMNRYFGEHPQMLLGNLAPDKHYGSPRLSLEAGDRPLDELLEVALQSFPVGVYRDVEVEETASGSKAISIPVELQHLKNFSYLWHLGSPYQVREGMLHAVECRTNMARKRLWWLIQIRDAVRRVIDIQWASEDDSELIPAQKQLGRIYDEFTTQYGWVHNQGNAVAFDDDPDFPLLLALEVWDANEPEKTSKADIFTRRTIRYVKPKTSADSAAEALALSLAQTGGVDFDWMTTLYPKSREEIIEELQLSEPPAIFLDPVSQTWLTYEEYVCDNVKVKLIEAKEASARDVRYMPNIKALEARIPKDLTPKEIYVQLSSRWLAKVPSIIKDFIIHLLDIDPSYHHLVDATYSGHSWSIGASGGKTLNQQAYGTSRRSATQLIQLALNQKVPEVYDQIDRNTTVKNRSETLKAMRKQDKIKTAFKRWVWQDWDRVQALTDTYNRTFNCLVRPKVSGAHLIHALQGVSIEWQERLSADDRKYQLDAIWHGLTRGNMLGQLPTGAGKTAIAVVTSQLMRQYGLCYKPAFVVPDHLVLQQAGEAAQIYPGLSILPIASANLNSAQKRQELVSRASLGEWQLIVISQTALKMMQMMPETIDRISKDQLCLINDKIDESGDNSKRSVKGKERRKETAKGKVAGHIDEIKRDDVIYFEQTGIDYLFVDESQEYLGLPTYTGITGVLSLTGQPSQKAIDLYYKSRYIASIRGEGKGLVLYTATPIRNTLGQAWVVLRYLISHVLAQQGITHFDDFISTFAEARTSTEITAAGTMETRTRLATWSNYPEFKTLWLQASFIVLEQDLKIKRPVPRQIPVQVPVSEMQVAFLAHLAERAKSCRGRKFKKGEDNWCAITSDAKLGVIDLRLLRPHKLRAFLTEEEIGKLSRGEEQSKAEQMIQDVYESWQQYQSDHRVQLIFCDLGTPNTDGRWEIYGYAKQKWIEMGVPESEIAFIHDANNDAQKAELFKKVREAKICIFLVSTPKAGVGTQIPDRLYQMRRVDCPMRPTDFQQQDGRIVRSGNQFNEVEIYSYITTGQPIQGEDKKIYGLSPDSYLYDVNRRKADFISRGLFSNDEVEVRTIEDIDETTMDFGVFMATASGDSRLLDKMNLDRRIEEMLDEEAEWQQMNAYQEHQRVLLPRKIANLQEQLERQQQEINCIEPVAGDAFQLSFAHPIKGGTTVFTKRADAGKALFTLARELLKSADKSEFIIGRFAGFELKIKVYPNLDYVNLCLCNQFEYETDLQETERGTIASLESLLKKPAQYLTVTQQELDQLERELEGIEGNPALTFERAEELQQALLKQAELSAALGLDEDEDAEGEEEEEEKPKAEEAVAEAEAELKQVTA